MQRGVLVLVGFVTSCSDLDSQQAVVSNPVARQSAPLTIAAGPTAAHGAIVWQDATGAVVPFFLQFGFGGGGWTDEAGGMFLDSNGIMWSFGPITCGGPLNICPPFAQYNNVAYGTYWDGTNCSGTAYVPYVHAGMAFTLQGPGGNTVRALKPNAAVAMQFLQSSYGVAGNPSGCSSSTIVHILAAPLSDAPIVTPPAALPFTPPVRPVMLN
jgi:hypothetical protein